jgi:hypothetical protein
MKLPSGPEAIPHRKGGVKAPPFLTGFTGPYFQDILAKIVGGSRMFPFSNGKSPGIGEQNIMSIKQELKREQIPLVGRGLMDRE